MNALDADVIIVGAGLSGVGAACHLREQCPDRSVLILEGRQAMGGTWDLFRYPGIRSDSDMHTLGYQFRPWEDGKAIADGPFILRYIRDTARDHDIEALIRYGHWLTAADWCSDSACWTLTVRRADHEGDSGGETLTLRCRFLLMCAGYYSYRQGHQPVFPGREDFQGEFIHPQFWPEGLDTRGKRVVVIGSGATAMTLVPELAKTAESVVMLQRSPTYVISRPARDRLANALRRVLPAQWAYAVTRWKNTLLQQWLYRRSRKSPDQLRRYLIGKVRKAVGDRVDVERHFTPSYQPWDQRLCLVPDGDLFEALRGGRARVVTDHIDHIETDGVLLASGEYLPADIIVSATGLELVVMGEAQFSVDGEAVDFARTWTYKGVMCSGVPNLVSVFGYINASWTLRADLTAEWFCRLLNHMREGDLQVAVPRVPASLQSMPDRDWIDDFSAGYMRRVMHRFPRQGDRAPWLNPQDYRRDRELFRQSPIDDGALQLSSVRSGAADERGENAAA
jgi:cation diffusion facilitator CzcD-associated flavoprotein CzcO